MLAWINVTPDNHEVYTAAYTYCAIIFAGIGAQLFYNFLQLNVFQLHMLLPLPQILP